MPVVVSQSEVVPGVVPQVNNTMPAVYAIPTSQPVYGTDDVSVNMNQGAYAYGNQQPRITEYH